jgi:hypothetical protein
VLTPFSGSYEARDVQFLLRKLDIDPIDDVDEKERLIQSGQRHYSEIIGREKLPSNDYLTLYEQSLEINGRRVAQDLLNLARQIIHLRGKLITLVSLARAGTPFGILLKRLFESRFGIKVAHYSISIIRDRGIDENALDYILSRHTAESLCFIDGWSGKGAIADELERSVAAYNASRCLGARVSPELFVLVDLAGVAAASGSVDDYLIPSAILNAPVSGLVSRTILNELIGPDDWHGCLFYSKWLDIDRSQEYVARIDAEARRLPVPPLCTPADNRSPRRKLMNDWVDRIMRERGLANRNLVKPGIGEATRAVLRRSPQEVVLKSICDPDLAHLALLCKERGVTVKEDAQLLLKAVAIIRRLGDV